MSNKTDRQILTELLNSLMDEEIVYVRERLMAIVDYSLHDEKLIRDGMVNSGVSADLYINTLKRIRSFIKYDTNPIITDEKVEEVSIEEMEQALKVNKPEITPPVINVGSNKTAKIKKRASNKK